MSLPETITQSTYKDGTMSFEIPPTWMQGRTAYGGFSAALALEAAMRIAPDLPPLRSAQISFVGPLAGECRAVTKLLRRGRSAAFVEVDVMCGEEVGLKGVFVFMAARESKIALNENPAPEHKALADTVKAFKKQGQSPNFTLNMDYRHAWPEPKKGVPDLLNWAKLNDYESLHPMTQVVAIADALPPAALPLFDEPVPVSSVTWIINMLTDLPSTDDGWWLIRARSQVAMHGCSSQDMHIWNADGVPIASGMQRVALFG